MQNRDQLYINGQWAASTGKTMIDVHSASTEEVIGRVPEGTPEDVAAAARSADPVSRNTSNTRPST
jgi:betaine-aldehyde dehydrogenase